MSSRKTANDAHMAALQAEIQRVKDEAWHEWEKQRFVSFLLASASHAMDGAPPMGTRQKLMDGLTRRPVCETVETCDNYRGKSIGSNIHTIKIYWEGDICYKVVIHANIYEKTEAVCVTKGEEIIHDDLDLPEYPVYWDLLDNIPPYELPINLIAAYGPEYVVSTLKEILEKCDSDRDEPEIVEVEPTPEPEYDAETMAEVERILSEWKVRVSQRVE